MSHHVGEGALLDFAGRLDSTKPVHRIIAWVLLVVFCLPVLFAALRLVHETLSREPRRDHAPSSRATILRSGQFAAVSP